MRGFVASSPPGKRRWKGFALAVVALVVFSLLVPLAFLLGLHNRFPYGYLSDDTSSLNSPLGRFEKAAPKDDRNPGEDDQTRVVENLIRRFGPSISKDDEDVPKMSDENLQREGSSGNNASKSFIVSSLPKDSGSEAVPTSKTVAQRPLATKEKIDTPGQRIISTSATAHLETTASGDETEQTCQLEFGSYCLWSVEYKEKMQDSLVKKMKDQLFVARSYYPSIAKLHSQEKLSLELRQNIQDHERMLSDALVDADLPINVEKKVHSMEVIIGRVKSFHLGCVNVNKKLQQILDLTEDEAHFHRRQSAFLYHLGVQTMSKSLHCLSLRLTVEYFNSPLFDMEDVHSERLANPALQHYVIFSSNILASAVAINSTVMNAKESETLVFHLLTDSQNFFSMKMWFSRNVYKKALIHVTDIEDYYYFLNNSQLGMQPHLSLSEEFRISVRSVDQPSLVDRRTEYISTPSHAYFLLPDIFKNLKRIVVLDDAVVVQRDLSPLWNLDLKEKAIGAVEFCELRLGHLESYLGEEDYDKEACLWLFGLNVVDLDQWRNLNVTGTYQKLLSKHMKSQETTHTSWRTAALPSSLLASQDLIYVLDDSWVLSGLGTNYAVSRDAIQKAAILHYNGNMKPWLELGIPQYKTYWRNYLTQQDQFMDECNVNR
ncbi:unnamed protein product [Spirodela intermedia]|uniref:Hexosyltransferase n=1 Tax=Spirodela intermedia TaxID=51605 RepID=A0A7I8JYS2_SPIIN|nr:unnamed protein product [Spirodela intermedia]